MLPKNLPDDINVELLFSYLPKGKCKVAFKGLHKRNAYSDIIDIEEQVDNTLYFSIGRNSLYNALPEFMFHPIDRFNELPRLEEKERFAQEYEKQEKEKENAYRFFAPIDSFLFQLRIKTREMLNDYCESNKALIDVLADRLTMQQRQNRLIKQVLPFLPSCKHIRGDKTLFTMMLRKVFIEEGLLIDVHRENVEFTDNEPRYQESVGDQLGDCYAGNVYHENDIVYDIHYWSSCAVSALFASLASFISLNFLPHTTPATMTAILMITRMRYDRNVLKNATMIFLLTDLSHHPEDPMKVQLPLPFYHIFRFPDDQHAL